MNRRAEGGERGPGAQWSAPNDTHHLDKLVKIDFSRFVFIDSGHDELEIVVRDLSASLLKDQLDLINADRSTTVLIKDLKSFPKLLDLFRAEV